MAFLFFEAKSKSLSDLKLAYLFRNLEIVEAKKKLDFIGFRSASFSYKIY